MTLFAIVLALAGLGVLAVMSGSYAASPRRGLDPLVVRQLIWIGIGMVIIVGAVLFPQSGR